MQQQGPAQKPTAATSDRAHGYGLAVRQLRLRHGWGQEELAQRAQLRVDIIKRVEQGDYLPRPKAYKAICDALVAGLDPKNTPLLAAARAELQVWTTRGDTAASSAAQQHQPDRPMIVNHSEHHDHHETFMSWRGSRRTVIALGAGAATLGALLGIPAVYALRGLTTSPTDPAPDPPPSTPTPALDGWYPKAVPAGSPGRDAIAMHNARMGAEEIILSPEDSPYWSYIGPVWLPRQQQLYFIAATQAGQHDIWHTPLTDNGPSKTPTPPSHWPQRLLSNRGPNCTSLALTNDGRGFIYLNAQGQQIAYDPDTGRTGTVAPDGTVAWSS